MTDQTGILAARKQCNECEQWSPEWLSAAARLAELTVSNAVPMAIKLQRLATYADTLCATTGDSEHDRALRQVGAVLENILES